MRPTAHLPPPRDPELASRRRSRQRAGKTTMFGGFVLIAFGLAILPLLDWMLTGSPYGARFWQFLVAIVGVITLFAGGLFSSSIHQWDARLVAKEPHVYGLIRAVETQWRGNRPYVRLELLLPGPKGEPYEDEITIARDELAERWAVEGGKIALRINPARREHFQIDCEQTEKANANAPRLEGKLVELRCPHCGAALSAPAPGTRSTECGYCETTSVLC